MDTKSKSSHRLGILIIMLALLLASASTIGLYPYMKTKAESYHNRSSVRQVEESSNFGNLATQVMNFSYEIWHLKMQEDTGRRLTYAQTFLPGLEEKIRRQELKDEAAVQLEDGEAGGQVTVYDSENPYDVYYYQSMQQTIDRAGSEWESLYRQYYSSLSYGVREQDGTYGRSNVTDPKVFFREPLKDDEIQFTISFNSNGILKVQDIKGNRDEDIMRLKESLTRFEFYDPLEVRLAKGYRYSGVEFQGPRDMTVEFRCSPSQMFGYTDARFDSGVQQLTLRDYRFSNGYFAIGASVLGLLAVLALALPAVKRFEIGKSGLCRLSFEPLSCIGVAWMGVMGNGTIPMALIASTMDGSLKSELLRADFLPWSADVMAVVINLAFWMVSYGMFYWGITCYRAIFSLGPWRYFKERTWLGRFLRFIKRWAFNALNVFNETDWERRSTRIIGKAIIANFVILTIISCLWFWGIGALVIYSLVLFFLLQKYWGQMQQKYNTLLKGINEIAEGNLDVEIQEDLGVFNPFKEQLSRIQEGFRKAVAQEVKSERTKSELITNVSHDLKTPLTAIITYVNLLKQENVTEEERKSYIRVLDQKSMRLKVLIEDLFEVSKASSGTVSLHLENVDIVSLLKQVRFELADKIDASGIEFRYNLPEERILLHLDSQKTYRVFENLLVNITKYGMPGTRAYIQVVREDGGHVLITMRNISARELEVSPEELTERFVRGDTSRNTEGSGLGLAIAGSFVEVQGGTMKLEVEDDLFRVSIRWKTEEPARAGQEPWREARGGSEEPGVPGMPDTPVAEGAPGKTAMDTEKENAGEIHGRESETDGDIDISTAAFDMEGVVWGAEEAEESKEDSKKDSKTDREE